MTSSFLLPYLTVIVVGKSSLLGLFNNRPKTWGFRGDPYLWDKMREVVVEYPQPKTVEEFEAVLADIFERIVGMKVTDGDYFLLRNLIEEECLVDISPVSSG